MPAFSFWASSLSFLVERETVEFRIAGHEADVELVAVFVLVLA